VADSSSNTDGVPTAWLPGGAMLPSVDPSQFDLPTLGQTLPTSDLITGITSNDGTASYSYDAEGELTGATYSASGISPESYSYDANGNRTGTGYVVGPNNEILSDGTYTYSYDAEGNCTERVNIVTGAVVDYTWDLRNRLVEVTDRSSIGGAITEQIDLSYDAENRWTGETVTTFASGNPASVHVTDFAYDGQQIALQFDADLPSPVSGRGAGGEGVSLTAADLSHRYLWGPAVDQILADERVTQTGGTLATSETLFPLTDNQGSVRGVAKLNASTGVTGVVDRIIYSSYGKVTNESNASEGCLFKFTARPQVADTDLQNNRARIFSVDCGWWLSQDPMGFDAGQTNTGVYCGNDPVNGTDPSGLWRRLGTSTDYVAVPGDTFQSLVIQVNLDYPNLNLNIQNNQAVVTPFGYVVGGGPQPDWSNVHQLPDGSVQQGQMQNSWNNGFMPLVGGVYDVSRMVKTSNASVGGARQMRASVGSDWKGGPIDVADKFFGIDRLYGKQGAKMTHLTGQQLATQIMDYSDHGRTPIGSLLIAGHGMPGSNQIGSFDPSNPQFSLNDLATVAGLPGLTTNVSFADAIQGMLPPVGWLTEDASVYLVGCNTDTFAGTVATQLLRGSNATAWGTTEIIEVVNNAPVRLAWFRNPPNLATLPRGQRFLASFLQASTLDTRYPVYSNMGEFLPGPLGQNGTRSQGQNTGPAAWNSHHGAGPG
jgi:RHS repeat-associated protein